MHRLSFCFLLFIVVAGCDILTGNDGSMRLSGRVTAGGSSSRTPEAITAVNRAIAAGPPKTTRGDDAFSFDQLEDDPVTWRVHMRKNSS